MRSIQMKSGASSILSMGMTAICVKNITMFSFFIIEIIEK